MRIDARKKMTSIETQYFRLNRILLLSVGLWPYKRSKIVRLQLIVLFSILTSFIVFQLIISSIQECTFDYAIKIFSFITFFTTFVIKYNSFWINTHIVKSLLEELQHIYNELKDENEIAIIENYGYRAKRYTIRIILITMCGVFTAIFVQAWPFILNIIMPTNKSRSHLTMEFLSIYFQERYFYLTLLHMNAAICVGTIAYIATGTMLIGYLKHACGMFRIARFAESLVTNFEGTFLFLIAFSVCCLSLNLFQIFRTISLGKNKEESLLHLIIVGVMFLYMFLANYAGQEITDHNNHVFSTAYNVCWYTAPLHIQKLILFLLQRGNKAFSLNVAGMFAASLKCFASLISSSISYFTVMYSTQQ